MTTGLLLAAILIAASAWVLRRHWWLTRVRSWSMYPTLRPGNLRLTRALRGDGGLRRGDIVVIDSAELRRRIVKRVIGLPGETVHITSAGVSVDDQPLDEPYLLLRGGRTGTYHVPANSYLVLGDNRLRSGDSRTWNNPYLPATALNGRLVAARGLSRHSG